MQIVNIYVYKWGKSKGKGVGNIIVISLQEEVETNKSWKIKWWNKQKMFSMCYFECKPYTVYLSKKTLNKRNVE